MKVVAKTNFEKGQRPSIHQTHRVRVVDIRIRPRIAKEVRHGEKIFFAGLQALMMRAAVAAMIIGLNWVGISAVGSTVAMFSDGETSHENAFVGGKIDFSLEAGEWEDSDRAVNMVPGESVVRSVTLHGDGSIPFQYIAHAVKLVGDDAFCDALELTASRDGLEIYNGSLFGLNVTPPLVIGGDGDDDWIFSAKLPDDSPGFEEAECEFNFVFDGWQEGFADGSTGFSDEETLDNILETENSTASGFSPIADSYTDQSSSNSNFGGHARLRIKSKLNDNNRSFIRFDFLFPDGTTILSSNLKLFRSSDHPVVRTYDARRVLESWNEKNPDGIEWNTMPGVAPASTDSVASGAAKNTWLSWNVTPDVKSFVSGEYGNYGWELRDSAESSATSMESVFYSREGTKTSLRPVLEINLVAPEVTTDHMVVNEVFYHVGKTKGSDPSNEWVEIYNPTSTAVDISGWSICDNASCDVIPASPSIPANKFAVITPVVTTWTKWPGIPADAIKIVLGSSIGSGLAKSGDRVVLKSGLVEIDAMSYGSDTTKLNPAAPLSGNNKSLARIIKGYDTDFATDWIINATPNPGTNPSSSGAETMRFTDDGVEVADLAIGLDDLNSIDEYSVDGFDEALVEEDEAAIEETETLISSHAALTDGANEITSENNDANTSAVSSSTTDFNDQPLESASVSDSSVPDVSLDSPSTEEIISSTSISSTEAVDTLPQEEQPVSDVSAEDDKTEGSAFNTEIDLSQPADELDPVIVPDPDMASTTPSDAQPPAADSDINSAAGDDVSLSDVQDTPAN